MQKLEDLELIKFFDWIRWHTNQDPRLSIIHHVANERKTGWRSGKFLKQKGIKSGVPDICCPIPNKLYHGLYIELKIKPNKLSETQEKFCKAVYELGYCVRLAYSGDEAIEILKSYLAAS